MLYEFLVNLTNIESPTEMSTKQLTVGNIHNSISVSGGDGGFTVEPRGDADERGSPGTPGRRGTVIHFIERSWGFIASYTKHGLRAPQSLSNALWVMTH